MTRQKFLQYFVSSLGILWSASFNSCSWVQPIIPSWLGGEIQEATPSASESKEVCCTEVQEQSKGSEQKIVIPENSASLSSPANNAPISAALGKTELSKHAKVGEAGINEQSSPERLSSTVEIIWQVPSEPVEVYFLSYGTNPSNLDQHVELPVNKIAKRDHPAYGPVFQYELANLPSDSPVYFSLQAQNSYGTSAPTPVVKVMPEPLQRKRL